MAKKPAKRKPAKKAKPAAKKVAKKSAKPAKRAAKAVKNPAKKPATRKAVRKPAAAAQPQHIGYRYDVNLLADASQITPFLKRYIKAMGWKDLNWLEDVHMGYEEGQPAVFDRNINGWVTVPKTLQLPKDQQARDMIARELLVKFQMSRRHPLVDLKSTYRKF